MQASVTACNSGLNLSPDVFTRTHVPVISDQAIEPSPPVISLDSPWIVSLFVVIDDHATMCPTRIPTIRDELLFIRVARPPFPRHALQPCLPS